MQILRNVRLREFSTKGSLGVVTDVAFFQCYWPKLDQPTALFADGSSGIIVEGPPTPRNVIFPPGTLFMPGTRTDCHMLRQGEFVSVLTQQEAESIASGKDDVPTKTANALFVSIAQSLDDPDLKLFQTSASGLVDVTAAFDAWAAELANP